MNAASREAKRQHVMKRVVAPPVDGFCIAIGCGKLTQRANGNGLSDTWCKKHKEMIRRHGSSWRKSYKQSELKPYLKASKKWTKLHLQRADVAQTLRCLEVFLDSQGEPVDAYEVRWLKPKLKARSTLARFREAKSERELFIIALALEAITQAVGPRGADWTHMQIAKRVHRVNSGSYRITSGGLRLKPKHPRAEGKGMRLAGKWVREEARVFDLEEAVQEVIEMATTG